MFWEESGDADETKILDEQAPDEVKKALFLSQSTTNKSACETNNGDSQSMTSLKLPENLKIVSNKRVFHELGDQFPHPSGVSDQGESSCDRGTDLTRLLKTVGVCDGLFLSETAPDQTGDIQKSTDCETQLTSNRLDETNPLKNDLLYDERREEFASVRKDLFEPIRNLAGGYDGPFVAREDTLFAENWSSKNRTEKIEKPSVRGGILKNRFMRQPSTSMGDILKELTHSPVIEHLRSKNIPAMRDSAVSDHYAKNSQAESAGNIFNDLYQMYPKSVVDELLRLWNIERQRVIADFKKMHQQRIAKMERAAKQELEEKVRSIKNGKETLVKLWECKERIDRFMKAPRFPSGGEEQQKQLMEALRVEIAEERAKLKTESDLNTQLKVGLAKATLEKEEQDANFTAMKDELRNLDEQLCDVLAAICDEFETQHIALNKNILGWLDSKPEVSNT
ncbi:unnamed protein product [Bemisia tabaci]|uniref:Uncharacterized protein n=1 Tax=Bemisia tabaci TaxID=7038 RepID=A0A9P0ACY1_BEMTA|nr:unnamed protein product [Bemisia tabaci]